MPTKNIVPVRVVESIDKRLMTADRLSESKLYLGKSTLHMGQLCPCLCLKTKLFYLLCYMLAFLSVEGDLKDVRRKILHVIILMGHFKLSPLLFFHGN